VEIEVRRDEADTLTLDVRDGDYAGHRRLPRR
jgi:hypothetical protein